jgi:hypothetical protein
MTLTRSLRLVLAALAAAAATAFALISTTGDAGARGSECPDDTLCLWKHVNEEGKLVKIKGNGLSNKLARKMNNNATGVDNNRDGKAWLYEKKNGKGEIRCIQPGEQINNLDDLGFNDVASSTRNANGSCTIGPPRR